MKHNFSRVLTALLLALLIFTAVYMPVSAKPATITSCVDLVNVSKNASGEGYYWANRYDTMTLTNLTIDTADKYGLSLPAGATVILEGDNYIKASYAALVLAGNTQIKGTGTLTLVSDDMGVYMNASNGRTSVTFIEGGYTIKAAQTGIYSPNNAFAVSGGTLDIEAGSEAFFCDSLKINTASIKANAPIHTKYTLNISASNLDITASSSALLSDAGSVIFAQMDTAEYDGAASLVTVSTLKRFTRSVLFGGNVPVAVDYILFAALIIIVGTVIFLKVYLQKRRDEKRRAEVEAIKNGAKLKG